MECGHLLGGALFGLPSSWTERHVDWRQCDGSSAIMKICFGDLYREAEKRVQQMVVIHKALAAKMKRRR